MPVWCLGPELTDDKNKREMEVVRVRMGKFAFPIGFFFCDVRMKFWLAPLFYDLISYGLPLSSTPLMPPDLFMLRIYHDFPFSLL